MRSGRKVTHRCCDFDRYLQLCAKINEPEDIYSLVPILSKEDRAVVASKEFCAEFEQKLTASAVLITTCSCVLR